LDVGDTVVGLTTGVATPLCFLLFPCLSELLRSALSSIRLLSGAIRFASDELGAAAVPDRDAPATLTAIAAATTAKEITSDDLERWFKCILSSPPFFLDSCLGPLGEATPGWPLRR
jgi:hypothetical protein